MEGILLEVLIFVFIIGLCIGSFLNVVILRSLSNESIVFPASKCPSCGHSLKWYHNIPVFSYLFLRGKCAFCNCKISIQYPIIELLTGILFALAFLKFFVIHILSGGITPIDYIRTFYAWIVISLLIVLAGTDIKEKIVFDLHTYILAGVGLVYSIIITCILAMQEHISINTYFLIHNPVSNSIFGILAGIAIMELLARSGYLFAGTRAFGEGDTFIAAGIGAVLGWKMLISALILSIFIQLIITLPVFMKKLFQNKDFKTITALSLFFIYAAAFLALQNSGTLSNQAVYIIASIILAIIGIYAVFRIIRGINENKDNMMYLPFGPAMAIAAIIMIAL